MPAFETAIFQPKLCRCQVDIRDLEQSIDAHFAVQQNEKVLSGKNIQLSGILHRQRREEVGYTTTATKIF
jgi:hypothetical protein